MQILRTLQTDQARVMACSEILRLPQTKLGCSFLGLQLGPHPSTPAVAPLEMSAAKPVVLFCPKALVSGS